MNKSKQEWVDFLIRLSTNEKVNWRKPYEDGHYYFSHKHVSIDIKKKKNWFSTQYYINMCGDWLFDITENEYNLLARNIDANIYRQDMAKQLEAEEKLFTELR